MGGFVTQGLAGLGRYVLGGGGTRPNPNSANNLFRQFLINVQSQVSDSLTNYFE